VSTVSLERHHDRRRRALVFFLLLLVVDAIGPCVRWLEETTDPAVE